MALTVAYPHMCSVGGDLFALVRRRDGSVVNVNASGAHGSAVAAIQTGTSARSLVGHLESLLPPASRVGFEARTAVAA